MSARLLLAAAAVLVMAASVHAAQYPGYGDTGWCCYSKRDCCAHAVALANEDSAARCRLSGGVPRPTSGAQRGSCAWESNYDANGYQIFHCASEASVWCR